ncbi:MAG: adenylate kinase [Clostridia bacterium]|nr:adenylate kinase [Clostridia bacterium]
MFDVERVLIVGSPGSGKSTFARRLAQITHLPLVYLDMLYWKADGTTETAEVFDARLRAVLAKPRWIMDGNYMRTLKVRLSACDTVFAFDVPPEICLEGALARIGRKRPDLPWIEEVPDPDFLSYIRVFPRQRLPRLRTLLDSQHHAAVRWLRSRGEADAFLDTLQSQSPAD